MKKAALEVRRRWQVMRFEIKQEPTEQQPAAPIVKQEQPEQHVGGGGFGSVLDYPHHRIVHGASETTTTNQMRGLQDTINLTGEGNGDGALFPSFSESSSTPYTSPSWMHGRKTPAMCKSSLHLYLLLLLKHLHALY
jgi:hypothetical protein